MIRTVMPKLGFYVVTCLTVVPNEHFEEDVESVTKISLCYKTHLSIHPLRLQDVNQ